LHTLQQEWDETVLEAFTLRQQLDTTRKELAHALYQYDAACRVIARIMKERDEAYQLLKDFQANGATHSISNHADSSADAMEIATEEGINGSVLEEWKEVCDRLSAGRKGRKAPDTLATKDEISRFQEKAQFVATSSSSTASINTIALKEDGSQSLLASGSTDKSILVTDVSNSKYSTVCKLNGHKGGVTCVAFSPVSADVIFSGSEDKTLRVRYFPFSP
jgi:pre-mRNA-processing factor 19